MYIHSLYIRIIYRNVYVLPPRSSGLSVNKSVRPSSTRALGVQRPAPLDAMRLRVALFLFDSTWTRRNLPL